MPNLEKSEHNQKPEAFALYEIAIDKRWNEYFAARFRSFIESNKGGVEINWAALVFGAWWFFYRKIWWAGFAEGSLVAISVEIVTPLLGAEFGIGLFVAERFVFSVYANRIYYREVSRFFDECRESALSSDQLMERVRTRFQTLL